MADSRDPDLAPFLTHEMFNQSEPLDGAQLFAPDAPLRDALACHAPGLALTPLAALVADWLPRLTARAYNPRFLPATEKAGVTMDMGMTGEARRLGCARRHPSRAVLAEDTP